MYLILNYFWIFLNFSSKIPVPGRLMPHPCFPVYPISWQDHPVNSEPANAKNAHWDGCFQTIPMSVPIQYTTPSTQLVKIPYRITGPAMVKILHPIPNTWPSASVKLGQTISLDLAILTTSKWLFCAKSRNHFKSCFLQHYIRLSKYKFIRQKN